MVRRRENTKSRDARAYIHTACSESTLVSGTDYRWISDPFLFCSGTYCSGCGKHVSLGELAWEDTGENIKDYRQRRRARASWSFTLWRLVGVPLIGAWLGMALGNGFARAALRPAPYMIPLGFVIGAVFSFFIVPHIFRLAWALGLGQKR